jgi:hypothetical protein
MQATPSLDFVPTTEKQLVKFGQMLQKSWRNLTTLINNKVGFGDGTNHDNIDGVWANVVAPVAPNTDFTITHNLGRVPVGYWVMQKDRAVDVYTGSVAATSSQITLRATVASAVLRLFILGFVLALFGVTSFAQTTSLTIQVTDAGGQSWNNGTWTAVLSTPPGVSPFGPPFNQIGTTTPVPNQTQSGALSATGSATATFWQNASIVPALSQWKFVVCPQATAPCFSQFATITSTATLTLTPPAISVNCGPGVTAYLNSEVQCGVGGSFYNLILQSIQVCQTASGSSCTLWSGSGSSASSPSTAYTFSVAAGVASASPNSTGLTSFFGSDSAVVLNNSIAATSTTCGQFLFKSSTDGTHYSFNSATTEAGTTSLLLSGTLKYAVRIPANAGSANKYCQWLFIGEQAANIASGITGGSPGTATGVIFDVTAAARTSAGAGNFLVAWWAQPDATNNIGNDVFFENITTRFPDNTRGNECAFCPYEASTVDYTNVTASLNTIIGPPNNATISPAVAGTNRMIGMSSTKNNHDNWQHFTKTWVQGYDIGYDIESEHSELKSANAILNNYFGYYGRLTQSPTAQIFHPGVWTKVTDQENIRGLQFGPNMGPGCQFLADFDLEVLTSTAFARVSDFTETNAGACGGQITYEYVFGGVGPGAPTAGTLFATAGQGVNISQVNSGAPWPYQRAVSFDSFTHQNGNCNPVWLNAAGGTCTIASNTAQGVANGAFVALNMSSPASGPQFSQVTVGGVTATNLGGPMVLTSSGFNYYRYVCSTSGGLRPQRAIQYYVANVFNSTLVQTVANSGCINGDVLKLEAIPTGSTTQLRAYYNGVLDLQVTDTNLTTGFPGLQTALSSGNGQTFTNWSGGAITPLGQTTSIYTPDSFRGIPQKAFVDTADYTNATTTFSNVIGVGSNNGLSFPVTANTRYTMHCSIVWSASAATAGPQFQITGPASPTSVAINMASAITATTTASAAATAFSSAMNPVGATVTSGANEWAQVDMELLNGANNGTVQLQAAAQGVGTTTIRQGSSCTLQ